MAQLVQAPRRQPRLGGIKDVVGEFVEESRLAVAEIAWEDSGCGMPKPTRAGCYDLDVDPEDKTFDGVSRYGAVSAAFAATRRSWMAASTSLNSGSAASGSSPRLRRPAHGWTGAPGVSMPTA
mgnify:CR=1 FL=1